MAFSVLALLFLSFHLCNSIPITLVPVAFIILGISLITPSHSTPSNMDSVACPIPQISISLAPPEEPLAEPYSPFSESYAARISETDDDSFRPQLLTPPPVRSPRNLSPLSSSFPAAAGKGLERERFEALLRASKERNAAVGAKRTPDLRKEIALKAHKNKQRT